MFIKNIHVSLCSINLCLENSPGKKCIWKRICQIHQIRWIKYKYKYMVWNLIKYKYKYKYTVFVFVFVFANKNTYLTPALRQRRQACRTEPNFTHQGPRSGTYFEDCYWNSVDHDQKLIRPGKSHNEFTRITTIFELDLISSLSAYAQKPWKWRTDKVIPVFPSHSDDRGQKMSNDNPVLLVGHIVTVTNKKPLGNETLGT